MCINKIIRNSQTLNIVQTGFGSDFMHFGYSTLARVQ